MHINNKHLIQVKQFLDPPIIKRSNLVSNSCQYHFFSARISSGMFSWNVESLNLKLDWEGLVWWLGNQPYKVNQRKGQHEKGNIHSSPITTCISFDLSPGEHILKVLYHWNHIGGATHNPIWNSRCIDSIFHLQSLTQSVYSLGSSF